MATAKKDVKAAETVVAEPVAAEKPKKPAPLFKKLAQFQTPDGLIFETQREASEHLRKHLVVDALKAVTEGNEQLVEWLLENKAAILKAYDAAKIERPPVTEETKAKMKAARQALAAKVAG